MTEHMVIAEGLKPCPLCGCKIENKVTGKLVLSWPLEEMPVYEVRCCVKCPNEFLTLDLAWRGYADAEGKQEAKQRAMLQAIMRTHSEKFAEIWNNRPLEGKQHDG